jgi:hypothetical protein
MKDENQNSSLLDLLKTHFDIIKKCPICEKNFEKKDIHIINYSSSKSFIHNTCSGCRHSLIFIVENTEIGIALIGILSDLNLEDFKKFKIRENFSENDLLESYKIINLKQKDFIKEIIK